MYLLITVIAGTVIALLSAISLWRCARDGGIFINQARFLLSGILLALHFPLVDAGTAWALPEVDRLGAGESSFTLAYWASFAAVVTAQVIILPTRRELYASYLTDRLARA